MVRALDIKLWRDEAASPPALVCFASGTELRYHLRAIEATSSLTVGGLISNTHVCRDTTVDDVVAGYRLTQAVSEQTGLPIRFVCGIPSALDGLADRLGAPVEGELLPIGLYLRDAWM